MKKMFTRGYLGFLMLLICFGGELIAQDTSATSENQQGTSTVIKDQKDLNEYVKLQNIQEASKKFENLGFGIAFSVSSCFKNFVTEAEVENGIIRLKKEQPLFGEIMLETHKFWSIKTKAYENRFIKVESNTVGIGPFLGILMDSGSDSMINAISSGVMVGFRPDTSSSNSLNIGVGLTARFKIKELRGDLTLDKALPDGVNEIKYQETAKLGVTVVFSFTWANL
jgi:hypothetical protein